MSGYIGPSPVPQSIQRRQTFTATAAQTTFGTTGYTDGDFIDVYLNGVKLVGGTDYTATNGTDVVLTTGAAAGDILDFVTFNSFQLNAPSFDNSLTLQNATEEDTDGGRESTIIFKGEQSGGEISTLAEIEASHDGTADDEKGDLIFRTNDGSDGSAPTERLRIDSAGTLAVGTTHTNNWSVFDGRLRVGARGILATTTASSQFGHNWYYDGSGYKYIDADYASRMIHANGYVSWEVAGSGSQDAAITFNEKARIDADGLKFNGDTAAANALDDYEEGTFSPVITGSTSGTSTATNLGRYTKIGRLVSIQFTFNNLALNAVVGNLQITNLPFATNTTDSVDLYIPLQAYKLNWPSDAKAIYAFQGSSNLTSIELYYSRDNDTSQPLTGAMLSGTYFRMTWSYTTAT